MLSTFVIIEKLPQETINKLGENSPNLVTLTRNDREMGHASFWITSSDWPPERKTIPGTVAGMVRLKAVTVARPTSSGFP
jgi:hypothetical protein